MSGGALRRVLYSVAASLDGYIAGPAGEFDWIPHEPEIDWAAFQGRFDTVLMGRKTWDAVAQMGSGGDDTRRTYVFSRTLRPEDHPRVTVVGDRAGRDLVQRLRTEPGQDIWLMGGGELFRHLLEAGLVDGVEVAITPVLLGRGLPLLPAANIRQKLELRDLRRYTTSGIVLLSYDVSR